VTARLQHLLLVLPGASLQALGTVSEVLAAANEALGDDVHASAVVTPDGAPVRTAGGLVVRAQHALTDAPPAQAVHVFAEPPRTGAPALHAWLRERAAGGAVLSGLGGGVLELAAAGLLDGHRATLDAAHIAPVAAAHPTVVVSGQLYEIDRARLTCGGGSAVLDLFIAWLGQRHGDKLVQALLAQFALERLRGPDERPRGAAAARSGSSRLAEAVSLMEANLAEPLPTEDIARLVGVSRRQLERLFKQHLDALPSRYYAELRLARARRLLQQSNQSILQVGLACGFTSGSHFSSAYRARYGHTPREARSQRAQAWRSLAAPAVPEDPLP
jgi:transcriptional regulator GlxA family with amidase domain